MSLISGSYTGLPSMGGATPAMALAVVEKLAVVAGTVLRARLAEARKPAASGVLRLGRAILRETDLKLRFTADMFRASRVVTISAMEERQLGRKSGGCRFPAFNWEASGGGRDSSCGHWGVPSPYMVGLLPGPSR